MLAGVLPSLPGFLVEVKVLNASSFAPFVVGLYKFAWFVGFAIAFGVYLAGRKMTALAPAVVIDRPQTALESATSGKAGGLK